MEFTINIQSLILFLYAGLKIGTAVAISKKEFKYPIWKNGVLSKRGIHDNIRAFIWHTLLNPEWALLKAIVFIPVFLFTGYKFIDKFKPWRIQSSPPKCETCGDKGKYYVPSMLKGKPGNWVQCKCLIDPEVEFPSNNCQSDSWFDDPNHPNNYPIDYPEDAYVRAMLLADQWNSAFMPQHESSCKCCKCAAVFLSKAIKNRVFVPKGVDYPPNFSSVRKM